MYDEKKPYALNGRFQGHGNGCSQKGIFDPFFQMNRSYSIKSAGTGLGLPMSRQMVEMHGGDLWVKSGGKGQGSCFCFELSQSQKNLEIVRQAGGRS